MFIAFAGWKGTYMPDGMAIPVSKMESGQSGKVIEIQGGQAVAARLNALGIMPGRRITKVSSMLMRGPITIQSGRTRLALGYGMAGKILVEPDSVKNEYIVDGKPERR